MRQILNNLIAFVGILDQHGTLLEANKAPLDLAGVTEADVIGKPFWECVWWNYSEDSSERLRAAVRRARSGETLRYDALIRTAGDGRMWIDFQLAPWRDETGGIYRLVASATDLSARRQAESRLRATERRFRTTFENAAVGMAHVGLDGTWLDANRKLCDILGYTREELFALRFHDVTHPDDLDSDAEAFQELLSGARDVYETEKRYIRKDGSIVWVQLTASVERTDTGEPEHGISVIQDISDRKRAEEQLRRNQERLRTAQLAGGVGLFEWDITTGVIRWTPELEALYGMKPGEFAGDYEAWKAAVHPEDLPAAEEAVRNALASEEFKSEWRPSSPDASGRWLAARGWVERDEHGVPIRLVGMNVDITERRQHEEQMRLVMGELNHRVKNTLAVIQSIAQQTIRRADSLDSFAARFFPRLQSMARAHSLLTSADWNGADLHDILASELEPRVDAATRLSLQGPHVRLTPSAALAAHMIVHELATNAAKHGALARRRGRIDVAWALSPALTGDRDPIVDIKWAEHGARWEPHGVNGFGSQLISKLLEYELHGAIETLPERHGLVHHIRFPLRAPLGPVKPVHVHIPVAEPTALSGEHDVANGPRILVVEDSYALASCLQEELEDAGMRVVGPCGTLTDAAAFAETNNLHAAVLDVDVAGESIKPVAERLRQRGVPFVLLTGFSRQDLDAELQDAPILSKPVEHGAVSKFLVHLVG